MMRLDYQVTDSVGAHTQPPRICRDRGPRLPPSLLAPTLYSPLQYIYIYCEIQSAGTRDHAIHYFSGRVVVGLWGGDVACVRARALSLTVCYMHVHVVQPRASCTVLQSVSVRRPPSKQARKVPDRPTHSHRQAPRSSRRTHTTHSVRG
jgi:hypothetical protein